MYSIVVLRFNQLRRRVDGVSEKMLSQALQFLERDGLVVREQRSVMPPAVDYELTDLGRGAAEHGVELLRWLEGHMGQIGEFQERYDAAGGRTGALAGPAPSN